MSFDAGGDEMSTLFLPTGGEGVKRGRRKKGVFLVGPELGLHPFLPVGGLEEAEGGDQPGEAAHAGEPEVGAAGLRQDVAAVMLREKAGRTEEEGNALADIGLVDDARVELPHKVPSAYRIGESEHGGAVVRLEHDDLPARPQHAAGLAEKGRGILHMAEEGVQDDEVLGALREGQMLARRAYPLDTRLRIERPRPLEEALATVHAHHRRAGGEMASEAAGDDAGPAAEVDRREGALRWDPLEVVGDHPGKGGVPAALLEPRTEGVDDFLGLGVGGEVGIHPGEAASDPAGKAMRTSPAGPEFPRPPCLRGLSGGVVSGFAVIVLNWNEPAATVRCVESLLGQLGPTDECTVIDNGSEDDSRAQLAARCPQARRFATGSNLGYAGGNNVGLRDALARGREEILLLNNDTVLRAGCLAALRGELANAPRAAAVSPVVDFAGRPGEVYAAGGRYHWSGYPVLLRKRPERAASVPWLNGCAILFRAEALAEVGVFDERFFLLFEDTEWGERAARAGWDLRVVPAARLLHEGSRSFGSTRTPLYQYYYTRNHWLWARESLPVARRWRRRYGFHYRTRKALRRARQSQGSETLLRAIRQGWEDAREGHWGRREEGRSW